MISNIITLHIQPTPKTAVRSLGLQEGLKRGGSR
jgi:hypothetical protein